MFWLLHTINSWLPLLKHIWSVRHGHPEAMYTAMLQLAGGLSTFSLDQQASEFPEYRHENLSMCFSAVDEKIRTLLETAIPTNCTTIPLRVVDRFTWAGTIADERLLHNTQFILAVSGQMGVDEIVRKTPHLVKAASTEELGRLIRHALPGLTLRHASAPPPGVGFRLNNQYFLLNQSGRLWDDVVRTRSIGFFVPSEIADAKLELLVVTS
jgi:type VI secretion system protein ImpJ